MAYERTFLLEDYCESGVYEQSIDEIIIERQEYGVSLPDAIQYLLMNATSDGIDEDAYLEDLNGIANGVFYSRDIEDDDLPYETERLDNFLNALMETAKTLTEPFLEFLRSEGEFVEITSVEGLDDWGDSTVKVTVTYEDS